ncbi:protein COBRA [Trifolium repens]|nr:protein COBRA [Trifolium repens]
MVGSQAAEQGDCSKFVGDIPHSCKKDPTIVDLLPSSPYSQRVLHCCKGGSLSSSLQDFSNSVAGFKITVGRVEASKKTVKLPQHFKLEAPGPGYSCGPAKIVQPTQFGKPGTTRVLQAHMTWNVTCTYSQFLAKRSPTCYVSLSSFYNQNLVPCSTCACGCPSNSSQSGNCIDHMCPIRVHWHIKASYKEYWRVKVTLTDFNYHLNYSDWNLVVEHPGLNSLSQVFSFNYKPLISYGSINDTGMFFGVKFFNDILKEAGTGGYVQTEILLQKNKETFTFGQ